MPTIPTSNRMTRCSSFAPTVVFAALALAACDPEDVRDALGGGQSAGSGGAQGGGGGQPDNPCAATTCLAGTLCEVRPVQCIKAPCPNEAVCVKVSPAPPSTCGPVCDIFCEHGNVLDSAGCPTCKCNPPPATTDPCATVRCAAGTHCEAVAVQCVTTPCPPVAQCVADAPTVHCGGIAAIACPGAGKCVDDPADTCDPAKGGADCGGICQCVESAACAKGTKFDSSPKVCACVSTAVCGPVCTIYCEFGNVLDASGCPTCRCNPPTAAAECPPEKCTGAMPKSANYQCTDGTTAGPSCRLTAAGSCEWVVLSCS